MSGSGAVIGSNGLVLTCAHVLNSPDIEIDLFGREVQRHLSG